MARQRCDLKYVAFVDILGFSDLIVQMEARPEIFPLLRDTLGELQKFAKNCRRYQVRLRQKHLKIAEGGTVPLLPKSLLGKLEMTAFSDCYVISESFPPWHVVAIVQALGSRLMRRGILTRGAIVKGLVHHSRSIVFGPAMIDAYALEHNVARFPRILVSDEVADTVSGYHRGVGQGRLLLQDVDGSWFINVFEQPFSGWKLISDEEHGEEPRAFLRGVRGHIRRHLRLETKPGHLSKWRWAANYFTIVAQREKLQPIRLAGTI